MENSFYENLFFPFDQDGALPINGNACSTVLQNAEEMDSGTIQQPVVIVGERGSGKTFILKKICHEFSMKPGFAPVLIEGRGLFSNSDIWRMCSDKIGIRNEDSGPGPVVDWQVRQKTRLVVLIDNIQYYFNRTDKSDHFALRSLVNSPESPMFVGTSDEVIPQFVDYDAAFFDGLRICYLSPIREEQVSELVPEDEKKRVLSLLEELPKTVRSMKMAQTATRGTKSFKDALDMVLNYHSEYCGAKYDSCLLQEQRILSALAGKPEGLTLKGIREQLVQDNSKISPYLGLMSEKGLLQRASTSPRKAKYRIKDKVFSLWLRSLSETDIH